MQFQTLILTLALLLFSSNSVVAQASNGPDGPLPNAPSAADAGDTFICYDPANPLATTTLVLGNGVAHNSKTLSLSYLQDAFFSPLTDGDSFGSSILVQVKDFSYRTHVGKTYNTIGSDNGILLLTVTEFTYVPKAYPLGVKGTYIDLHTKAASELNCQVFEAYN